MSKEWKFTEAYYEKLFDGDLDWRKLKGMKKRDGMLLHCRIRIQFSEMMIEMVLPDGTVIAFLDVKQAAWGGTWKGEEDITVELESYQHIKIEEA